MSLFASINAAITLTSCSLTQIVNAFAKPPDDHTVRITCSGTVVVNSTLTIPDGLIVNSTGRLVLEANGNFPVFSLVGSAYIGGLTLKGGKGVNGGCLTTQGVNSETNLTLWDMSFENCVASGVGGGVYVNKDVVAEFSRVNFWDCSAESGGGLGLSSEVLSVSCTDCDFRNNTASGVGGGAIFTTDTSVAFLRASFINNRAFGTNSSGGAVYNLQSSFSCQECMFRGNFAAGRAGALYTQGAARVSEPDIPGSVRLVDTYFLNNTGSQRGGVVFVCLHGEDEFTIQNGAFCDNQLTSPDGLSVGSSMHADCEGNIGVDSVSFSGNLPGGEQFAVTSGIFLMFFQFSEVDTENARVTCDAQQNLTNYPPTVAPTVSFVSEASSVALVVPLFVAPLMWF